jgi:hypothetical protein
LPTGAEPQLRQAPDQSSDLPEAVYFDSGDLDFPAFRGHQNLTALPAWRNADATRYKIMTVVTAEFMRRFLLDVLPSGLHPWTADFSNLTMGPAAHTTHLLRRCFSEPG